MALQENVRVEGKRDIRRSGSSSAPRAPTRQRGGPQAGGSLPRRSNVDAGLDLAFGID